MESKEMKLWIFLDICIVICAIIGMIIFHKVGVEEGKAQALKEYKQELQQEVRIDTVVILKYKMIQDVENARNLNDSDVVKLFNKLVND